MKVLAQKSIGANDIAISSDNSKTIQQIELLDNQWLKLR